MTIKTYLSKYRNPVNQSLFALLMAISINACDQSTPSSRSEVKNEIVKVDTTRDENESANDSGLLTLEELEQQLLPLKTKIKSLEDELENNQSSSAKHLEKLDDKKWNVTKLKETISVLKSDNQDLQNQLKESSIEVESLQKALKKTDLECNENIKIRI